MKFKSNYKEIKYISQSFLENEIKNETMLFSADLDFARKNGDGLTNLVLDNIPEDWQNSKCIIDSRVHMLMKGWYPCIPGWHHDDVPRKGKFGQPNYINPEYYSEHLLFLVNGSICPTEFIISPIELDLPPENRIIYEEWNSNINDLIDYAQNEDKPIIIQVPDSTIIKFTWQDFHKCISALNNGWRYFIRISRYWNDREFTIPNESRFQRRTNKNEIRRQVQVYLAEHEKGW